MSDIQISLSNIRNTKSVFIEGMGAFTVRKLGAGEELDLSDKMRRLSEIFVELQSIDFTKYNSGKKSDIAALKKIQARADALSAEVAEIQRFELETYKKCFTGKNVDLLLNTLSVEERTRLFQKIFPPLQPIKEPDTVTVEDASKDSKES